MKTCLTLTERSLERLERKLAHPGRCDLVEARLDFLDSPAVPALPESRGTQLVATCRPVREGGGFAGSERERLALLQECARAGFDWIDIELDTQLLDSPPPGCRIIRSHHVLDTFPDLGQTFGRLRQRGGDLLKLAVAVTSTAQLVRLLSWMEEEDPSKPRIIIGMNTLGQASRYLGELLGNAWTYVSETGAPAAPGQFDLETALRLSAVEPRRLYGVLGRPVAHSLSPLLHNALFRKYRLDSWYLPLELDDLGSWFDFLSRSRLPFQGFSVTLPFKTEVVPFLSSLDSPVDSSNTLIRGKHGWRGSNTDLTSFLQPLQRRLHLPGKSALVLGNGGVAVTVVEALKEAGVEVTVLGRDSRKVADFVRRHGCRGGSIDTAPLKGSLLVNTTPVGQSPAVDQSPVSADRLEVEVVYDLVYNPPWTRLLREASELGCQAISGIEMFVAQAALQFEGWTGLRPDRDFMADCLRSALNSKVGLWHDRDFSEERPS